MQALTVIPFADIAKMAEVFFTAKMYKLKTPEQALGMMLLAQAEGLHPVTALMRYHVMEDGRPAKKAEVVLADFQDLGGKCEWISDAADRNEQKAKWTYGTVTQTIGFTMGEAMAAGYVKQGSNWVKDPAAQLRARAITRAVRMLCPRALGGLSTPQELADVPIDATAETWTPAPPAPVAIAPATAAAALAADHLPTAPATAAAPAPTAAAVAVPEQARIVDLIGKDAPAVLAYLVGLGWIKAGQGIENLNQGHEARIRKGLPKFLDAARKAYTTTGGN